MTVRKRRARPFGRTLTAVAVGSCFATPTALANPTGANVVRGTAAIHQAGNLLQITNSPNAIINWQSFSIGANEVTRFLQQSSSSAVLNRVTTQNPSTILGALQSNGRVFLINPNGILFGAGAQVDVAGLVASTLNLSDQDFLAGRMRFTDGLGKSVVNDGSIATGAGGSVYLIGSGVTNNGIIRSPQGEVVLAAGNNVELVSPGTPNLRVEISATDNEARNLGQIISEAGRIGIYAGLINNSGTIRADSAQLTADGRIVLKATKNTTLEAGSVTTANGPQGGSITIQSGDTTLVSGTVEAKGTEGAGGTIQVLGNLVGLTGEARIDASGDAGGGTVLVGGDFQGKSPEVQNAFRTYVGPDATIKADAITSGDGGKVIVWADDVTRYYGNISARGGAQSGDGGLVEVSGHESLIFRGTVDASAPKGLPGRVLLDPKNIIIANGGPDSAASANNEFADNPAGTVTIDESSIEASSVAGTNVTLQANNDITVNEAIGFAASGGTDGTLTLQAGRSILINQNITGTDGAFVAIANSTVADGVVDANRDAGAAVITMANGVTINTGSGNITLAMSTGPTTNNTSGDITISNLTTTGSVLISQGGQTAGSSILRTATSLVLAASVALDVC